MFKNVFALYFAFSGSEIEDLHDELTRSVRKFYPLSNKPNVKAASFVVVKLEQLELRDTVSSKFYRQKHDFFEINQNYDLFNFF